VSIIVSMSLLWNATGRVSARSVYTGIYRRPVFGAPRPVRQCSFFLPAAAAEVGFPVRTGRPDRPFPAYGSAAVGDS